MIVVSVIKDQNVMIINGGANVEDVISDCLKRYVNLIYPPKNWSYNHVVGHDILINSPSLLYFFGGGIRSSNTCDSALDTLFLFLNEELRSYFVNYNLSFECDDDFIRFVLVEIFRNYKITYNKQLLDER